MNNSLETKIIIAHFGEDLHWTKHLTYKFDIISKNTIPDGTKPNRGKEASSYISYIVKNCQRLSDITIFTHGHRNSWHHPENIDQTINSIKFYYDYFNINSVCSARHGTPLLSLDQESLLYLHSNKYIIENKIKIPIDPVKIKFRPASCFYVSKKTILKHKIETYQYWLDWFMTTPEDSEISSRIFEYCWHIIFTGSHVDRY